MTGAFEQALRRYGQTVTVTHGGESRETKAFLQEKLEKDREPPRSVLPLGESDERRWIYIGSAGAEIAVGDRVCFGELHLTAQQAEAVWLGNELCHWWAQLAREKETVR